VESFGFRLRRVSGSHYIYTHPQVARPLSLQPRNREAKPYQISQFLDMVREFERAIDAWLAVARADGLPIPEPRYRAPTRAAG
jgi:HicA toxin of bacterial toxin-antitoxin,